MNKTDSEYFRLLRDILDNSRKNNNRTGVSTIGIFGAQAKFDVKMDAFPILTTKRVWFKGIVHELLWFIKGDTNIKYLVDNDVHIWDEWAFSRYKKLFEERKNPESKQIPLTQDMFIQQIKKDADFADRWGELGEGTYGGMWRNFPYYSAGYNGSYVGHVDQLQKVIGKLKTNPDDRRMIVSAWHPYWVDHCALPPCHCLFHFHTEELTIDERKRLHHEYHWPHDIFSKKEYKGAGTEAECDYYNIPKRRLNLLLYQRSCDTFLGIPFNITSYSLLLAMVSHCVGMEPGVFTHTYGDLHIYENHMEQVKEQLSREPKELPKLWLNPNKKDLFSFTYDDIKLIGYEPHPKIEAPISV